MNKIYLLFLWISISQVIYGQNKKNTDDVPAIPDSSIVKGMKFRSIGPAVNSGRISDIAVDPQDQNVWYVVSASGGVWKTENAGNTWMPVFDDQGSYSIGCVSIDPSNHHIIWIGTGENNNQRSMGYGDGVYKSMDGGKSWKNTGLIHSEHIGSIVIHPDNSEMVYVAAYGPLWSPGGDRGIYKSTDGGNTWKRILAVSDNTGFNEIHMDPRNPDILYAAAHQRRRHVYTYISGGPESAVYKSTDGGLNWYRIMNGFPSVDLGRIGLAISPVEPDIVYAIVEAADNKGGFYRSLDRGERWEKMSNYTTTGNYYQEIFCDPKDRDRIYAMDTWLHFSENGGKTFNRVEEKYKHVDNHAMWIDTRNTSHMLVGCDGGLYETYNNAENWYFFSNLPITQFYKVSLSDEKPFYYVYGGTQDNFSLGGPSRTTNDAGIVNSDWYVTNGGDGFESVVDPEDPDIIYAQSQYGWLVRYDRKSGEALDIKPIEGEEELPFRWNWDAPLVISSHDHTRLYFAANKVFQSDDQGNTWKEISDDLTRQIDRNKLPVMGKVWSVDAVAKNASTSNYGNIVSLAESPLKQGSLYAGTDDGLINVTENDGETWRKMSAFPGVPERTYVNYILPSRHSESTVYAAFNNHKNGDFKPYILKSTDNGFSWHSISSNLPVRGSVYCISEDPVDENLLFTGTEFGAFFTVDGGLNWIRLKSGLPTIAVRDMAIQERENDLVLATFGRGIYILDDYMPLRSLSGQILDRQAYIFPVKNSLMFLQSKPLGLRGKSFQGSAYFTADNPPVGATFTYYLKEDLKTYKELRQEREKKLREKGEAIPYPSGDEMRLEDDEKKPELIFNIYDEEGNLVRKLKKEPERGIHRITWNFRYPPVLLNNESENEEDNPFSEPDTGPLAVPGDYFVSMSKFQHNKYTELVKKQKFKTSLLSTATLPAEDQQALFDFEQQVQSFRRIVSGTNKSLDEFKDKLKYIKNAAYNTTQLPETTLVKITELDSLLNSIDRKLNGDYTLQKREFPVSPSITDRVGVIVNALWYTTTSPTQTQIKSLKTARHEFTEVYDEFKNTVIVKFAALEKVLEDSGAPWTPGRLPEWKK